MVFWCIRFDLPVLPIFLGLGYPVKETDFIFEISTVEKTRIDISHPLQCISLSPHTPPLYFPEGTLVVEESKCIILKSLLLKILY